MGLITNFVVFKNFWTRNPASHPKYQKTQIVAEFPIKTSAKYYHLTVWAQGQVKWAKVA